MLTSRSTILLLLILFGASSAGAISVSQSLSDDRIAYEDSARFEIVLTWPGPQSAFRFDRPLRPTIDKLRIGSFSSSISSTGSGSDEVTTKTYKYTLLPTSSGLAVIEPVTIEYMSWPDSIPGSLVSEQMSLTIARPLPPKEQSRGVPTWVWIIAAVAVVGVGGWGVYRLRNKPETPVVQPPVDRFLDSLGEVKTEAGSDIKRFQTGLHRILIDYMRDSFELDPEGMSEDDLSAALAAAGLAEAPARSIAGWYTRAARDKFRPVNAGPGEAIRLESEIRSCFENL